MLAGAPCISAAAPADSLSEDSFLGNLPVVLSVSRLAQPQAEAPGAVTVIDSETIRRSGARDVTDVLRLVPGFQVGNTGSAPRVYYHGALEEFGQHMQVLIDGRSVYSPYYAGGINWNNIPLALEDIERIEAVRGSNAAAYGANSFLGVINIITKHASVTPLGWGFAQNAGGGVNDSLVRYGGEFYGGAFRLTAGRRADSGVPDTKSDRDVRYFALRADWRSGLDDEFHVQAGGTDSTVGRGRLSNNGDQPRDVFLNSDFLLFRWLRTPSPNEELRLTYYHSDERSQDAFPYPDPHIPGLALNVMVDTSGAATRDSLELQHTFVPGKNLRLVWGGELRHDAVKSMALYAQSGWLGMDLLRAFGNLEWRATPALILNLGASAERSSLSGYDASPRLAINYHLTPEHTLRAGVSRATRAPSIFEEKADLAFYQQGMPVRESVRAQGNLGSEHILSQELGYLADLRSLGLTADLRLFHERISDLSTKINYPYPITALPTAFTSLPAAYRDAVLRALVAGPYNQPNTFINSTRVMSIRGLEYQLSWRPWQGGQVLFNQAFMQISSPLPWAPGTLGDRDAAPAHSTSIALYQKFEGGMDVSAMFSNVGAMYWAGSSNPRIVPGYQRVDLRLAKRFLVGTTRMEAALTAQGLGGDHAETDVYYKVGSRVFGSLSFNF